MMGDYGESMVFRAYYNAYADTMDVMIGYADARGKLVKIAQPLVFVDRGVPGSVLASTFAIERDAAQQAVDELYRLGYSATEAKGSAGALSATERHLKDMQTIAFDLIGRKK